MKTIKILFRGLGPKESVTYKNAILRNGAAVDMPEEHAKAYLEAGIAFEVTNQAEVKAAQDLEQKNAETRKRVQKKTEELAARQEGAKE